MAFRLCGNQVGFGNEAARKQDLPKIGPRRGAQPFRGRHIHRRDRATQHQERRKPVMRAVCGGQPTLKTCPCRVRGMACVRCRTAGLLRPCRMLRGRGCTPHLDMFHPHVPLAANDKQHQDVRRGWYTFGRRQDGAVWLRDG
ncbi:hypothetical protein MACH21_07910 [Roseicyclus marinus]|uniref:Uncharacterized protein n=1 Tax=Roseicyclus marinus TaxID=2161673 RepID=A0AA48KHX5_9RHOB|nr:hypothetical protein MACH21_07910 [Roseicyclus marinus]